MAYSLKDLKKLSGNAGVRKIELEDNVTKKLWIPKEHFEYVRTHFNIRKFTTYKSAKWDIMPCFNQAYGENGKGCPICDEIQKEWAKWRKLPKDAKDAKKDITNKINQMVSEEFWMNAIDISSEDKKFGAIRFTRSKMEDLLKVIEFASLEDVIWYYKKVVTVENGKKTSTKYSLNEDTDQNEVCEKLKAQLEYFISRSYEDGGMCDLGKLVRKYESLDHYISLLNGEGGSEEEVHEESARETHSSPKEKQSSEPKEMDEELSLDDLDNPTKKDELDLDGSGLDDIGLEEEKKMVKITKDYVKENQKNQTVMNIIYEKMVGAKKVQACEKYADKVRAVYAAVSKEEFEVVESDLSVPF